MGDCFDKDQVISNDHRLTKSLDTVFKNAVSNLNIKDVINGSEINRLVHMIMLISSC